MEGLLVARLASRSRSTVPTPRSRPLAAEQRHLLFSSLDLNRDLDDAVAQVLGGFVELR